MFRTELPLTPHPQQLPQSARVLTIGSCFSDSIGTRLRDFRVDTLVNPFGTVFNPISLCRLLRAAAGEDMDWQQHVVEARGRWQSYDLHAELGADSPVELLQRIQTLTREVGVFLATADAVVLTLGSAFAYRLRETDEIISNCHKVPAEKFDKELLTADDIIAAVAETHAYLRRINPRLQFILTVSPVRHLKDTLVLNSASKSMLRVACHYLSDLLPGVTYFPAYELLMDDLRDYRFYASDMLHPSEVAENYIWERFTRTYFDAGFGRFKKEWESVRQALGHRPLHPAAPEHRQFLESTLERLRKLNTQADVRMELLHVERELAALPMPPPPPEPEPEEDDDEERIDIGEDADTAHHAPAQASLLGEGAGVLVEPLEEEEETQEAAFENPESAYEHAYTAALAEEEVEDDTADPTGEGEAAEPARRKKRRSRGGAKRTKRKHARLAAEAAAALEATGEAVTTTEALPAAEAVPVAVEVSATQPTPDAVAASAAAEAGEASETAEPARRSRNNRRNRRDRPAREGNRRAPLYATEAEATPETAAVPETTPEPAPMPEQMPVATPEPVMVSNPEPAVTEQAPEPAAPAPTKRKTASRSRRKAPAAPVATEADITLPTTEVAETPLPAAQADALAETPTPETAAAPAKARSRRKPAKPAAKAVTEAASPVADLAPEPSPVAAQPEAPAAPARKRAPRKAKPAATPPAVVASAPGTSTEPAPDAPAAEAPAPPKRKPRAPRRKPAADAPAPENQ